MKEVKTGDRVRLVYTDDPYTKLVPGDEGVVEEVTPEVVYVIWDSGSSLGMIPGTDRIEIVR